MSRRYPALIALACIGIVVAFAASTSGRLFKVDNPFGDQAAMFNKLKADPAIRAELRFAAIRDMLPPDAAVGYFGQSDDDFGKTSWWCHILRYTLAPRVVVEREDLPLLVANYPDDDALSRALEERARTGKRYRVVARAPKVPGVALVENTEAKR